MAECWSIAVIAVCFGDGPFDIQEPRNIARSNGLAVSLSHERSQERACSRPAEDHWSLRDMSADIVATIIKKYVCVASF